MERTFLTPIKDVYKNTANKTGRLEDFLLRLDRRQGHVLPILLFSIGLVVLARAMK